MSLVYYVVGNDGKPKSSWEEILCDKADVHPTGLVCFYIDNVLHISYMLAHGEALIYCGEE